MNPLSVSSVLANVDVIETILSFMTRRSRGRMILVSSNCPPAYGRRVVENCEDLSRCWPEQREAVQLMCVVHCDCLCDPFDTEAVAAVWRRGLLTRVERHAYLCRSYGPVTRIAGFGRPLNRAGHFSLMMQSVADYWKLGIRRLGYHKVCNSSDVLKVLPVKEHQWFMRPKETPSTDLCAFIEEQLWLTVDHYIGHRSGLLCFHSYDDEVASFKDSADHDDVVSLFPWFDFTAIVDRVCDNFAANDKLRRRHDDTIKLFGYPPVLSD